MDIHQLKYNENGLIPVIVQDDDTQTVLMLAYMNKDALLQTLKTGLATYFSRSREKIWVKGETSGNFQVVKDICFDCDSDTILMRVAQKGHACHTGSYSCFTQSLMRDGTAACSRVPSFNIINTIFNTISDRDQNPKPGSYTNYLLEKGIEKICKKVGEEASETIIASISNNKCDIVNEIADLVFHLLVLLYDRDLKVSDVLQILEDRHTER